jgi:competence protein ComEA
MNFIRTLAALALAACAFAVQAADINRANQAELEAVKGIGPALATRILQARSSGPFKDWADVQQRVAGVKQAKAARLSKEGLTVAGAAFSSDAATPAPAKKERAAKGEGKKPSAKDKAQG